MTLRPLLYTHARHRRIVSGETENLESNDFIRNQHRTFLKYLYETIAQYILTSSYKYLFSHISKGSLDAAPLLFTNQQLVVSHCRGPRFLARLALI